MTLQRKITFHGDRGRGSEGFRTLQQSEIARPAEMDKSMGYTGMSGWFGFAPEGEGAHIDFISTEAVLYWCEQDGSTQEIWL